VEPLASNKRAAGGHYIDIDKKPSLARPPK
jgi:hypothetical protein